jgi:hypothetical protein
MVSLNRLRIKGRLYSGFGLVLLILTIVAGTTVLGLRDGQSQFGSYAQVADVTKSVMSIDRDVVGCAATSWPSPRPVTKRDVDNFLVKIAA